MFVGFKHNVVMCICEMREGVAKSDQNTHLIIIVQ